MPIFKNVFKKIFNKKYPTRERERVKSSKILGFTLIELLVVISIIGLLASIILASLNTARAKARDARRMNDAQQITTAIQMYYDRKNSMPINRNFPVTYNDNQPNFLQELVDEGFLINNPKDPQSPTRRYYYFDYGPGSAQGAMLSFHLETITNHPSGCGTPVYEYEYRVCITY